jgi:hypothetical protein
MQDGECMERMVQGHPVKVKIVNDKVKITTPTDNKHYNMLPEVGLIYCISSTIYGYYEY